MLNNRFVFTASRQRGSSVRRINFIKGERPPSLYLLPSENAAYKSPPPNFSHSILPSLLLNPKANSYLSLVLFAFSFFAQKCSPNVGKKDLDPELQSTAEKFYNQSGDNE